MSRPLWEVMADAHNADVGILEDVSGNKYSGTPDGSTYAAELLALANWIEKRQMETYGVVLCEVAEVICWLQDEADRAEAL